MAKSNNNKILISIALCLFIGLLAFIVFGLIVLDKEKKDKVLLENPNIYNNIFIAGFNVSNMSLEDAKKSVESIDIKEEIKTSYKDKILTYNKKDFGLSLDKKKALDEAYNIAREGNKKDRLKIIKNLEENPKNITLERVVDENVAKQKLENIAKTIRVEPQNAKIEKVGENFTIVDGKDGVEVDIEATYKNLIPALKQKGDTIFQLVLKPIKPKYNKEELAKIKDKLGSFSTSYAKKSERDEARITNLKTASSKINGTILYPGEVFSTNEKFGDMTAKNGYRPAPTIIQGKLVDEYGGGVCQVSSTLYNAILYSELEVVERQNHSLKVGYTDYGFDATLAGDYIDLKFKNSTSTPIYIESYVTDNQVVCNIYGYDERPKNRTIKFENALVDVIEPGPSVIKKTDKLPFGQEQISLTPLKGYKYKVYKLIYEDGKLVEKQFVNNSYYKPRAEEKLVGIKK